MNKRLWDNKVQCLRLQQILEARQKKEQKPPAIVVAKKHSNKVCKQKKPPPKIPQLFNIFESFEPKLPVKAGVFYSGRSFMEALQKKGWERLGSGAFSWVLGKKGSDKVIKISKGSDGGWMNYIKWATDNGYAGTFAPKVFSYKWVKGTSYSFSICFMERLEKTIYNTSYKEEAYVTHTLFKCAIDDNPTAEVLMDLVQPGLGAFARNMYTKFGNSGLDLHRGNFMVRKGGELVCIDPVSSGSEYRERFKLASLRREDLAVA